MSWLIFSTTRINLHSQLRQHRHRHKNTKICLFRIDLYQEHKCKDKKTKRHISVSLIRTVLGSWPVNLFCEQFYRVCTWSFLKNSEICWGCKFSRTWSKFKDTVVKTSLYCTRKYFCDCLCSVSFHKQTTVSPSPPDITVCLFCLFVCSLL